MNFLNLVSIIGADRVKSPGSQHFFVDMLYQKSLVVMVTKIIDSQHNDQVTYQVLKHIHKTSSVFPQVVPQLSTLLLGVLH